MSEYELIRIFRPLIIDGLTSVGIENVGVFMGYQPTKQGATDRAVYFHAVSDILKGYPKKSDFFDNDTGKMMHEEAQLIEATFQINTIVKFNETLSSTDLAYYVSAILQRDSTIQTLASFGIGLYHIGEIRKMYFKNFNDENEAETSFDIVLQYERKIINEVGVISSKKIILKGV